MTEADGSGKGDSPAVEKFRPRGVLLGNGVGTLMGWGRIVVTLAGLAAAAAACAPAFVFAVVFVLARAFAPVCVAPVKLPLEPLCPAAVPVVAPVLLLPLVPIRGVCARLNGTVATHIAITPSLIELIWVI